MGMSAKSMTVSKANWRGFCFAYCGVIKTKAAVMMLK
jgi:hypothetical protein